MAKKYNQAMDIRCTSETEALMTLGVGKDASPDTIKRKYKELIKKYHPDQNGEFEDNMAKMLFLRAMDAFDYLCKIGRARKAGGPVNEKKILEPEKPKPQNRGLAKEPRIYGSTPQKKDSSKRMKELSKRAEEQKRAMINAEIEKNKKINQQIKSAERAAEIIKQMMDYDTKRK